MKKLMITNLVILAVAGVVSGQTVYVPASANAEGAAGTQWSTDLQVKAGGEEGASFMVELLASGEDNSEPLSAEFSVAAGQSMRLRDLLADVFEFSGIGALRVTATSGEILVTSRTFNDDPGGTYGQYVPAISEDEAASYGSTATLLQLSRSPTPTDGFRANIGIVNVTGQTITIEIDLLDADGLLLGTLQRRLQPYGYLQINDVFPRVGASDVDDGYAMLRTTTDGGSFITYASVVDNRSGDAVFIPGQVDDPPVEEQERVVIFEALTRDT